MDVKYHTGKYFIRLHGSGLRASGLNSTILPTDLKVDFLITLMIKKQRFTKFSKLTFKLQSVSPLPILVLMKDIFKTIELSE